MALGAKFTAVNFEVGSIGGEGGANPFECCRGVFSVGRQARRAGCQVEAETFCDLDARPVYRKFTAVNIL